MKRDIYIASYGKNKDKGIYVVEFDDETYSLTLNKHIETKDFPSYIITNDHHLYISYKNASPLNDGGGLGSYSIKNHQLVLNNNYSSSGRSYTHLCLDKESKYVFAANYHVGATASYELRNSTIVKKLSAIRHNGHGPDPLKRQSGPHAHYVGLTPDHHYVYSVDLGADKIVLYRYDNGILVEDTDKTLNIVPGSGPRHMIFSQDGRFAYLVNEIANNIMVFKYHDGRFILLQSIRCVPRHFTGFSSASAIRLTKSGEHLFVSNRGHDSIAFYRVNKESGKISLLYMVHTKKDPRDFNIIDNRYILIGAQSDNRLQLMLFDEENEILELTEHELEIPAPVCITFE